jgi:hypothetical protein
MGTVLSWRAQIVRIDDRTDDFDTPLEYERWLSNRASGTCA